VLLFEDGLVRASGIARGAAAVAAASGKGSWREQVRAGLTALLMLFDDEPGLGWLLVVDALAGGPQVLECRAGMLDALAIVVDRGRTASTNGHGDPPPLTAEGAVSGVLGVIHSRMVQRAVQRAAAYREGTMDRDGHGLPGPLLGLLNPLMGIIVRPYLGGAVAREESTRPLPQVARPSWPDDSPNRGGASGSEAWRSSW
jgi:hypothetical protein